MINPFDVLACELGDCGATGGTVGAFDRASEELQARCVLEYQRRLTVIDHTTFRLACERADATMKKNNGHTFETILKTRCIYCRRSPLAKGKCRGWFMTFLNHLEHELDTHLEKKDG